MLTNFLGMGYGEYGSNLLINSYEYNDNGRIVTIKPFKAEVVEIMMVNAANEKQTFYIGGILDQSDLKEQGYTVRIACRESCWELQFRSQ